MLGAAARPPAGPRGQRAEVGTQRRGALGDQRVAMKPLTGRCPGGQTPKLPTTRGLGEAAKQPSRRPELELGSALRPGPRGGDVAFPGAATAASASRRSHPGAGPRSSYPGSPRPRAAGRAQRRRALTVRCRGHLRGRPRAGPSPRAPLPLRRSPSLAGPRRRGRTPPHGRPARGAGPPSSNAAAPPVRTRAPAPRMRPPRQHRQAPAPRSPPTPARMGRGALTPAQDWGRWLGRGQGPDPRLPANHQSLVSRLSRRQLAARTH